LTKTTGRYLTDTPKEEKVEISRQRKVLDTVQLALHKYILKSVSKVKRLYGDLIRDCWNIKTDTRNRI